MRFRRRFNRENLPHKGSELVGKIRCIQRGNLCELIRFAAVVGIHNFAIVIAEKQRLAATDFATVQDKNTPVFIAGKCARQGAVNAVRREIDFCGECDFFTHNGRADAKTVPAFFLLYLLRVP